MENELGRRWDEVYGTQDATQVSWYQTEPRVSRELIEMAGGSEGTRVIDVGGGASVLVDRLLALRYNVTVLDISTKALEQAQRRLGSVRADAVRWVVGDISQSMALGPFDVWHDRAVFHFLTEPEQRRQYVLNATHGIVSDGHLIVATFAEDGPERCSGLPVCRYSPALLAETIGAKFRLLQAYREVHLTPWGAEQPFNYCLFRREK